MQKMPEREHPSANRELRAFLIAGTAIALSACTGDAAMDASFGNLLGGAAALATGNYDAADQFATQSQQFYSMAQTGDYVYDAEKAHSWTGADGDSSAFDISGAPSGNTSNGLGAPSDDARPTMAASSAASRAYPPSMGELGEHVIAARPMASPHFSQRVGASGLWIGDNSSVTKS
jgi:hypothetical protein